jgi:hypothetical protein
VAQEAEPAGQRAATLLAVHAGLSHADVTAQTGLTAGQIRYLLTSFRKKRLAVFPADVLSRVQAPADVAAEISVDKGTKPIKDKKQPVVKAKKEKKMEKSKEDKKSKDKKSKKANGKDKKELAVEVKKEKKMEKSKKDKKNKDKKQDKKSKKDGKKKSKK